MGDNLFWIHFPLLRLSSRTISEGCVCYSACLVSYSFVQVPMTGIFLPCLRTVFLLYVCSDMTRKCNPVPKSLSVSSDRCCSANMSQSSRCSKWGEDRECDVQAYEGARSLLPPLAGCSVLPHALPVPPQTHPSPCLERRVPFSAPLA